MSEERVFPLTKLSAGDKKLTQLFLERAHQGDEFICWGCGRTFKSEDDFKKHFQEHINEFFQGEL